MLARNKEEEEEEEEEATVAEVTRMVMKAVVEVKAAGVVMVLAALVKVDQVNLVEMAELERSG